MEYEKARDTDNDKGNDNSRTDKTTTFSGPLLIIFAILCKTDATTIAFNARIVVQTLHAFTAF